MQLSGDSLQFSTCQRNRPRLSLRRRGPKMSPEGAGEQHFRGFPSTTSMSRNLAGPHERVRFDAYRSAREVDNGPSPVRLPLPVRQYRGAARRRGCRRRQS